MGAKISRSQHQHPFTYSKKKLIFPPRLQCRSISTLHGLSVSLSHRQHVLFVNELHLFAEASSSKCVKILRVSTKVVVDVVSVPPPASRHLKTQPLEGRSCLYGRMESVSSFIFTRKWIVRDVLQAGRVSNPGDGTAGRDISNARTTSTASLASVQSEARIGASLYLSSSL